MTRLILGIDPGSRSTGIVLRRGQEVVEFTTVLRLSPGLPDARYLEEVNTAACGLAMVGGRVLVAVEGLVEPNPHMGLTNVMGLVGTGMVLASVLTIHPAAVVVPPGGNGSGPLTAYPAQLRPARGRGRGQDQLRHCRSAWDVAGAALGVQRIGAA